MCRGYIPTSLGTYTPQPQGHHPSHQSHVSYQLDANGSVVYRHSVVRNMVLVVVWKFVALLTLLSVVGSQENGDLRLSGGAIQEGIASGRVEIYLNKTWGTVDAGGTNDKEMITKTARTVCSQLGYDSAASAGIVSSLNIDSANSSVPMLLKDVQCQDSNLHILRCSYQNSGQVTPNHSKDFAVRCNVVDSSVHPYSTQVRLVQGGTGYASSGYLEIFMSGSWGPTCNIDISSAYAACRQLGYTESVRTELGLTYQGNAEVKADAFHCNIVDNYSCIKDCISPQPDTPACYLGHDIINCTFLVCNAVMYPSGGRNICSSSASEVALAVGLTIGMLLLAIIVAFAVISCYYRIPCILLNIGKRRSEYREI